MKSNACTDLAQFVQVSIELLKKAQKELENSDAIRGGTFIASTQSLLKFVEQNCNILAPMQMFLIPDGKNHVDKAVEDAKKIIDDFQILFTSSSDETKKS